jgi:hypothetical protein
VSESTRLAERPLAELAVIIWMIRRSRRLAQRGTEERV